MLAPGKAMADVSRRTLIKATGAIGATMLPTALAIDAGSAQEHDHASPAPSNLPAAAVVPPQARGTTYLFFNNEEAAFIEAAVARLIPKDEQWAGALEAGVPNYIDKQLGGAWGAGERLYRSGPWQPGTPSQGYQLPFMPAELFKKAIGAINKEFAASGTPFAKMSPDQHDSYLRKIEPGGNHLDAFPSQALLAH